MSQNDQDKFNFGAPDLKKDLGSQEEIIRKEVNAILSHLSPEARESVIRSRLNILINPSHPKIVQADLGENASRKIKEGLFE